MADYSLVPVEHQPDFENATLVPVDHNPFPEDEPQQAQSLQAQAQQAQTQQSAMGAGRSSAPIPGVATTGSTGSTLAAGAGDFFKSIPRGVVSGFNSAASALGRATQAEMGQDVDAPTPEQGMQILEKEVTGPMYRPEGRAGQFGASVGEFLGNPASYVAPGGVPLKVGAAVLGGLGSEAGGQLGEGTPWEVPLRFAGGALGVLGPLGAARLGTGARAAQTLPPAAEEASARFGQAAENAPQTFYRGDQAGLTEFRSHAARAGGQAYSEAVLAEGDQHDLMTKHALDSRNPPSPYIAVTTDPNVARIHGDTTYRLQLAPGRATPNPYSLYSESEYLVPHYISPDEIKGTLP
ncbi:hypothetical protein [uncultured Bradyrhizobium sp.]|jgi:hypothetical protein|uniref:hypothetical protein n=1 Tax=uncultured Bradyrhizobium sp. TaxID=199684 RepID=UPI00261F35B1|nr:hypothetical protein [uncultured Bradyrhizobium sp.]